MSKTREKTRTIDGAFDKWQVPEIEGPSPTMCALAKRFLEDGMGNTLMTGGTENGGKSPLTPG